jgi:hypothetical protein
MAPKNPQRWPTRAGEVLLETQMRFDSIDRLAHDIQQAAERGKFELVIAQAARIRRISYDGRQALGKAALGRYS